MTAITSMEEIQAALDGAMGIWTDDIAVLCTIRKFSELRVHYNEEQNRYYILSRDTFDRYRTNGGKWSYED